MNGWGCGTDMGKVRERNHDQNMLHGSFFQLKKWRAFGRVTTSQNNSTNDIFR